MFLSALFMITAGRSDGVVDSTMDSGWHDKAGLGSDPHCGNSFASVSTQRGENIFGNKVLHASVLVCEVLSRKGQKDNPTICN